MNYTAEEKELIVKWRPYYEKLISDAIQRVVQKEKELIPSYIPEEPEELNIVEKAAKKLILPLQKKTERPGIDLIMISSTTIL